jgi:hypothetical protein
VADPYKSVGGYWFICEHGHRIRQAAPDLDYCPVPGVDAPCGAVMDYRLVDYWTLASYEASTSGKGAG